MRVRPWALEEQLLGPPGAAERDGRLVDLATRLSAERSALSELEAQYRAQLDRVTELEAQLEAAVLANVDGAEPPQRATRLLTLRSPCPPPDRDYWLSRSEGFAVQSARWKAAGIVAGLRFGLRIDRPDQLEVELGRVRRRTLLVPVDEVGFISGEEELIVLDHEPLARRDLAHALLARVRGKPRVSIP